ncbi:MAG: hypothetical protein Q9166_000726 [cf. Caloplaca sp. 2 TL-2023]
MIELKGGKTAPRLLEDLNEYDPRRPYTIGYNLLANLPRQHENGELPTILTRSPRLRPDWIELLTDMNLIKSRAHKAMSGDPTRFEGHGVPLPSEVLLNLRTYILKALRDDNRRAIQAHDKRWLLCLGDPCAELLEYIGFVRENDNWLVPRPDISETAPVSNPVNILLEDVEKELLALLLQRPDDEKRASKVQYGLTSASRDFKKLLSTVDYKQNPSSRSNTSHEAEHPFYPSLGAKMDFHDDLIKFAYERQLVSDPEGTPYYLEALQGIAEGRRSEDLQTFVAIEASSGKVSARDIRNAYSALGLDLESEFMHDDYIIGNFQSRSADSPRQEPELRRALQIIGKHRSSQRIQSMASKTITTFEQALSWLGATEDMEDGFVVTMYKVKEEENPAEEATARQAVSLIAQHRKSSALEQWLQTGVLGEVDMDIGQAYNRLQIDDRSIDDDLVLATFDLFYQEAPSQVDDLRSALRAIAKDRKSSVLNNFLDRGMATMQYPLAEWPVGLDNIGNTCYLNSLLQYYFTIKPFRSLVLDFDEYKRDVTVDDLANRTIGSRNVSRQEVHRAQKCKFLVFWEMSLLNHFVVVDKLQELFQSMIRSSKAQVKPEKELARLTLLSQPVEADLRRRSTIGGKRPSLGEINGRPLLGPLPPSISETVPTDVDTSDLPLDGVGDSISSDGTLLGNDPSADQDMPDLIPEESRQQQREFLEDKENLPPTKVARPEHTLKPLAETSPSRTNEQHPPAHGDHEPPESQGPKSPEGVPPTRPPPFPPRPQPEEKKDVTIQEEIEIGAQQDVTEVIANVLYQLECAIKPTSFDASGEQIDLIKELFFGKQKSYTRNLRGDLETKEQRFSTLFVDVASGPKTIYEALDGAFDVQQVEVEGALRPQFSTISQLPPVLNILVQRAQYDQKTSSAFKSNNHLELKETIYMDRYVDSHDSDLVRRREESWEWKRQLHQLAIRRGQLIQINVSGRDLASKTTGSTSEQHDMEASDLLAVTKECLNQLSEDDNLGITLGLQEVINAAAIDAKEELDSINDRIKDLTANVSSQFVDRQKLPYRLHSAFIHRGSASSGHYWIYIRDFQRDMWREYNDEKVSAVKDVSQIYDQDLSNNPATPYFLVYVRDDLKDELVDPVHRDIPEEPETLDAVMDDLAEDNIALYNAASHNAHSYNAAVRGGQGTTAVRGDWFEADYVKPQPW